MRSIFINRPPIEGPWGGGNLFVRAFWDMAPKFGFIPQKTLHESVDVVLMVEPRDDGYGPSFETIREFKIRYPKIRLVHRVNECDARKATDFMDALLRNCGAVSDATIFVSHWLQSYHEERGWPTPLKHVVYNGVDGAIFKPGSKWNDGKIHLVTHHWSNNPLKGFDVYDALDTWIASHPDFTFTYIGRERSSFSNSRVVPPLFGEELGRELGRYDVYISASRFDPGPNHILESLSCKIPTYVHQEGGGCIEFAGDDHQYNSFEDLTQILERRSFAPNQKFPLLSWEQCVESYCRILSELVT